MHPYVEMVSVETLCAHMPSFAGPYRALVGDYGEDLTPQVVFHELADLTAAALLSGTGDEAFLEEAFSALERVAALDRIEAVEAVGFCFLAMLPSEALALADAYLGPRVEAMLEELLAGTLDFED